MVFKGKNTDWINNWIKYMYHFSLSILQNSSNSCCSGEDQEARHQDIHGPGSVLPGERWAGGRHHVQVSVGERTVYLPHWPWPRGNIPWPLKMSFISLYCYCVPKIKCLLLWSLKPLYLLGIMCSFVCK